MLILPLFGHFLDTTGFNGFSGGFHCSGGVRFTRGFSRFLLNLLNFTEFYGKCHFLLKFSKMSPTDLTTEKVSELSYFHENIDNSDTSP